MKGNAVTLLISASALIQVLVAGDEEPGEAVRIGIYDSRAIAVGFVGSEAYQRTAGKEIAEKMASYRKAESRGDRKKLAELEAWGEARQALLHRQGFSTAPVDDILRHIATRLPAIKQAAGVAVLVSKWDEKALKEHGTAVRIDVTMRLVEAFKPTEMQKKLALEIQTREPVPLDQLMDSKD